MVYKPRGSADHVGYLIAQYIGTKELVFSGFYV
jgi:hypothetical protein